jgi:hypothetical protein
LIRSKTIEIINSIKSVSIKTYITAMSFFNGEASSPTLVGDLAPHDYEN